MIGKMVKLVVIALATAGVLLPSALPAAAATGGCTPTFNASACISWSDPNLLPDFYMNQPPDWSMRTAVVDIYRNGSYYKTVARVTLTTTGRYGPYPLNRDHYPSAICEEAYTRLTILAADGSQHFAINSPKVNYCS